MKTLALLALTTLLVTSVAMADEMESIFDGKTLDGWVQYNGTATYRVEDGAIVGKTANGRESSFLCTTKSYGDFEMTFEVKVDDPLNSGVQIRSNCKGGAPDGQVNGPQIEIAASGDRPTVSGNIYGEGAGGWLVPKEEMNRHKHFISGEWNNYRIMAEGPRIQVWINGAKITDLTHEATFKSYAKGFLGLQVHRVEDDQGPFEVRWRKLMIKELK
jgi:hypothetical protein